MNKIRIVLLGLCLFSLAQCVEISQDQGCNDNGELMLKTTLRGNVFWKKIDTVKNGREYDSLKVVRYDQALQINDEWGR